MALLYIIVGFAVSGLAVMLWVLWPRRERYVRPRNWPKY